MLHAVPVELKDANAFVDALHRHHGHVVRDKYRIGCADGDKLVGVVQVGRPLARMLCDGKTLEVVRLCTDGTKNACTFLYSAAARVAKEMGYAKIITYILETESGVSLRASGWHCEDASCGGGSWSRKGRERNDNAPTCKKQRWSKTLREDKITEKEEEA